MLIDDDVMMTTSRDDVHLWGRRIITGRPFGPDDRGPVLRPGPCADSHELDPPPVARRRSLTEPARIRSRLRRPLATAGPSLDSRRMVSSLARSVVVVRSPPHPLLSFDPRGSGKPVVFWPCRGV